MATAATARRALQRLLHPAARLLGRLRYAQKFAVVGLVLLVALALAAGAYVDLQRDQIAFSARERSGIAMMTPLVRLTSTLVQERHKITQGAGVVGDLAGPLSELDALDRRIGRTLRTTSAWQATRRLIGDTRNAGPAQHGAFDDAIDAMLALIVRVGDESNLTLDQDIGSHYLMDTLQFRLPTLLDVAGHSADAALAGDRDDFDPAMNLGLNHGIISDTRRALGRAVDAVVDEAADASVRAATQAGFHELLTAVGRLDGSLAVATSAGHLEGVAEAANAVLREADGSITWVAAALDRLLNSRISGYTDRALRVGVGSSAAALLASYLFGGFYLAVTRPIRRIVDVLGAVADGDLTRRVSVDTRDELGFVSQALNDTIARTEVATDRLATRATHDPLTQLPNRDHVLTSLAGALDRSAATGELMCVLFVDLDRFKIVNDTFGHEAGDEVLRTVAERLSQIRRAGDTVGRLAGDEFVVVCERLPSVEVAVRVAERIVERVTEPIVVRSGTGPTAGTEREASIGASVGIALAVGGAGPLNADGSYRPDPSDLLRDADVAMYHAKQRGRGRVEIFDDRLRQAVETRMELRDQLRHAIDADEIVVHYQPIVSVADHQVLAVEALARWRHPTRGMLVAGDFIEVATDSGLIIPLGRSVLRQACRQAARWRTTRPDLRVTVNVSAAQLVEDPFVDTVAGTLAETGLDPDALWLEITETSLMADASAARSTLEAVRALGVHVAVDDFGTGYSSLAYLRLFPVEMLKIDRSFVAALSGADEAIVTMIVALARALGLTVVAEGVETTAQLARLAELGCGIAQGHLFGRPAPPEEVRLGAVDLAAAAP